jgi:hypothetical protein
VHVDMMVERLRRLIEAECITHSRHEPRFFPRGAAMPSQHRRFVVSDPDTGTRYLITVQDEE